MRLGVFDSLAHNPYVNIPTSVIAGRAHRLLARRAAREGIVLLKNARATLPLATPMPSTVPPRSPAPPPSSFDDTLTFDIAVVGPHANATTPLLGSYSGIPVGNSVFFDAFCVYALVL